MTDPNIRQRRTSVRLTELHLQQNGSLIGQINAKTKLVVWPNVRKFSQRDPDYFANIEPIEDEE